MNTDTPETNEALAAILDKDGYLSEDNAPDVLVKLCRTMERERDNARERVDTMFAKFVDTLEQTRNERDEIRAQLREEQQLHVKTLDERDEARENPWCAACREPDCCVSGDGTCAMIRKYLSQENANVDAQIPAPTKPESITD